MPLEQVPGELYVRLVVASKQFAPGGELHETPAQGSALQAPPLQPKGHTVSLGVDEQVPPEHTAAEYVLRVVAFAQMGDGSVQAKVCEV